MIRRCGRAVLVELVIWVAAYLTVRHPRTMLVVLCLVVAGEDAQRRLSGFSAESLSKLTGVPVPATEADRPQG